MPEDRDRRVADGRAAGNDACRIVRILAQRSHIQDGLQSGRGTEVLADVYRRIAIAAAVVTDRSLTGDRPGAGAYADRVVHHQLVIGIVVALIELLRRG